MTNKTELNQAIEFIRKAVIMAAHPEAKSYEEALKSEVGVGCEIEVKIGGVSYIIYGKDNFTRKYLITSVCDFGSYSYEVADTYINNESYKIIGQPLTLARILNAFKEDTHAVDSRGFLYDVLASGNGDYIDCENSNIGLGAINKCKWKFLNKDGSDAILKDQEPETILAISKL